MSILIEVKINGVNTLVDPEKLEKLENGLFAEHYNEDGTIDVAKEDKAKDEKEKVELAEIKAKEKDLELSTIVVTTTNGNTFDGNETARNNMLSAITSADIIGKTEEEWKLADNTIKVVSLQELKEALALAIQQVGLIVRKY